MKRIVGYLKELSKICFAKDAEGHLRGLQAGDPVYEGETIVDESGNIVLDALRTVTEDKADKHLVETDIEGKLHGLDNDKNSRQMQHESHYPKSSTSTDMFESKSVVEVRPEATLLSDTFIQESRELFNVNHILADVEEDNKGDNVLPPLEITPPSKPDVPVSPSEPDSPVPPFDEQPEEINHSPIAAADTQSFTEVADTEDAGTVLTGNVLTNDTDVDGDTLGVTNPGSYTGTYGTLILNSDGTYSYTLNSVVNTLSAGNTAQDQFNYTIGDGNGGSAVSTLTFTLTGSNDTPNNTAVNDLGVQEDGAGVSGSVTFSDVDNGDTHTFSTTQPTEGSVAIDTNSGTYTFNPGSDFQDLGAGETRNVSFDVTVTDNNGASDTQTVNVTVTGVNDAPVANLDGQTSIGVNLNGTDGALVYDSQGGNPELLGGANVVAVAMTIKSDPGSKSLLSYAAPAHNNEFLLFTDTAGTSVGVYVNGSTKSLNLGSGIYDGNEHRLEVSWDSSTGSIVAKVDGTVTDTDTLKQGYTLDSDGVLMLGQEQDNTGGGLDPNQIFKGVYSDVEIAVDGATVAHWNMDAITAGQVLDTVGGYDLDVTGDVVVVEDAPELTTNEDTPLQISDSYLLANDTDIDANDTLFISSVQDAVHGTVTHNGSNITFTPDTDYYGAAQFSYTVSDGNGGTDTQTVYLQFNALNDAPVATDDNYQNMDTTAIAVNQNTTDGALVYDSQGATPELLGGASSVTVAMSIKGDTGSRSLLSYAAPAQNNEFLLFTDTGGTSVGVYINGSNKSLNLGSGIYDGSEHRVEISWDNTTGNITAKVDGTVTDTDTLKQGYTLDTDGVLMFGQEQDSTGGNLDPNQIFKGLYSDVEIAVNGSTVAHWEMDAITAGQVLDTVGGYDLDVIGDVQVVNLANPLITDEDTTLTIDPVAILANDTDVDGDSLNISNVTATADTHGSVTLNGDGSVTFTPDLNYNGEAKFDYTVSDGNGGTDTATVTLNVLPVNDAPVIDQVTLRQPARDSLVFWNNMDEAASDKSDLAQNGHTATEVGTSGIYTIADDTTINTGTYDQKTIAASFTTGSVSAADPFQVIYEQGGAWNGYSISVKGDHLYASVWGESYSTIDPDYAIIDLGQISANTNYNVVMVHDGTAANGGTLTAYLDGVQSADVKTGVGQMGSHSGDVGIDGYKNDTIDPTNPTANVGGDGGQFQGTVHEVMSWNSAQGDIVNEAVNYFNKNNDTTTALEARLSGTIELFDVDASDVEDGTALTYTLQNDFGGLFSVDASTGVVSVNADELFQSNTYTLNVEAVDSDGATASTALTVDVKGSEVVHLDMNGQVNDIADSGTVVDNGQLHNGASVSNGDTLVLDGVDDYLDFASSADINQGTHLERSVALWFKTGDSSGTQYVYAEGGGVRSLQIYTENGILKAKGYNDPDSENGWKAANATVLNTNINVADNQWHHVAITTAGDPNDPLHGLDANGFKIYLDGTLQASGTGGAIYGHDNAHIGSYYNGTQTFDGEIDGFRLYNDALTAAQVQELNSATVIDGIVSGLYYETAYGLSGYTDDDGSFAYRKGDTVTFKVGDVTVGSVSVDEIADGKVFLQDIADTSRTDLNDAYVENMAVFLQSLDSDGNPDNGIDLDTTVHMAFEDETIDLSALSDDDIVSVIEEAGYDVVDKESAMEHVENMLETYGALEDTVSVGNVDDSDTVEEAFSESEDESNRIDTEEVVSDEESDEDVLQNSDLSSLPANGEEMETGNVSTDENSQSDSKDIEVLQLDDVVSEGESQESVEDILPSASQTDANSTQSSESTAEEIHTENTASYDPTVVVTVDEQVPEAA